jgi:hypothetical protein
MTEELIADKSPASGHKANLAKQLTVFSSSAIRNLNSFQKPRPQTATQNNEGGGLAVRGEIVLCCWLVSFVTMACVLHSRDPALVEQTAKLLSKVVVSTFFN